MLTSVQIGDVVCDNRPDEYGVVWICEDVQGWGSPGGTLEVAQRSGDHGGWAGDSHLQPRILEVKGSLIAPDHRSAVAAVDRLIAAVALGPTPLVVNESGLVRSCVVRRQDDVLPTWVSDTSVQWSAQVVAPDPRKYGAEQVASTGLPSSSGGLTWPTQWPQRWDATVTAGVIRLENAGTIATLPRLIVHGPVVGPQVALVGSGRSLAWDVELSEGQWMDVDLGRRTSLINGQVSRAGAMTSRDWFELPPGVSELAFSAQVHDPASLLTVAYRSAWQ